MSTYIGLEKTDGFRYFTFKPPISDAVLRELPMPQSAYSDNELARPTSVETDKVGQITAIGFEIFSIRSLIEYHQILTTHLNPQT